MIKFPDACNMFPICNATENDGSVLDRSTVVGSNYVNQGFCVIKLL